MKTRAHIIIVACIFSTYSWCLYQLAYANGQWTEMTGKSRALRSCNEIVMRNHGEKYDELCRVTNLQER